MKRKIYIVCILIAMLLGSSLFGTNTSSLIGAEELVEYEIYPKPHEITYGDDSFVMRDKVNLVLDSTIDSATKKRMNEVLTSKGMEVSISNQHVEGKTNIILGTYGSEEYADTYIQKNYMKDVTHFEKIDAYALYVKQGEIVILGKDSDAVFYGVTSLKHVLNQIDGSELRSFSMLDYADTPIRGFIEGYYGIPWTNEDRMSLMKFGGDFKMTSYVFAPKDDLYHTSKWRELYPEEELANIAEMVQVGIDSKCKFVWTAHPFMGGFNAGDYENEMIKLKAKFEQLYSVGVRQFGILGDDVGSLDKQIVVNMMNELSAWGKEKGDVFDFVFCPAGYNAAWTDFSELNVYDPQFPEDVQIFWTGNSVCAPIIQDTLTKFRTQNLVEGLEKRRSPLFWLNWPVNDINMSRLLMGKGSLLHTDINVDDLGGVVTNPMQDAEPSKVSLFAIADYAWNVSNFDDDKSWKDSFRYIDSHASDALYTLAQHMSDPSPNGHGLVLGESDELSPQMDRFQKKIESGQSILEDGKQLMTEMDEIIKATDTFLSTSENERMLEQVEPFAKSLRDLALATKAYIATAMALEVKDTGSAWENFADATVYLEGSKSHDRLTIGGTTKARPGSKRLTPFAESLRDQLAPSINEIVGEGKVSTTVKTNIPSIYSGKLENVIDGNEESFVWFGEYEKVNQYIELSLNKPTTIYGVKVLAGTTAKPQDTFGYAKLQYTTDGTTWVDIKDQTFGEYAINASITGLDLQNVVGVRYLCTKTGSGNKWSAMREFSLSFAPEKQEQNIHSEVIRTKDEWDIYSGSEAALFDDDDSAGVWYKVRQNEAINKDTTMPGDFLGVRLSESVLLGKIKILGGPSASSGDYFKQAVLEYSNDGIQYTKLQDVHNQRDIEIDVSSLDINAQYVRLRNTQVQNTWVGYRTLKVEQKKFYNGYVYTNVDAYKENDAEYQIDTAYVAPSDQMTLKKGEYIGLKLDRIHEITDIKVKESSNSLSLEVANNTHEWRKASAVDASFDARYIRLINLKDTDVTFDLHQLELHSREFGEPTISESTMGSIASGKEADLFDKNRSTGMKYQKAQVKGDHMIVDLGQEVDLDSLKIVCHDTNKDYIRDGLVYASLDGTDWKAPIITIGDQIANTEADDATIMESFPGHEISYNTASVSGLGQSARFIKIEITQPYAHRWTQINEIEINDGAYIPTINDPTFVSSAKDTVDGYYRYMMDGDVATMFTPDRKNESLTYRLSENNTRNNIKIIQNRKSISKAVVEARILNKGTRQATWITLGTLSQSVNDFVLPKDAILLDVQIKWKDDIPSIIEMNISNTEKTEANTDALASLLAENVDVSTWTTSSRETYENAVRMGNDVLASTHISQASIDSAVVMIHNALDAKEEKGDVRILQEKLDQALTNQTEYTVKTWLIYTRAISEISEAMKDPNNISIADIETYVNRLNTAESQLQYHPRNMEQAKIALEDLNLFLANIQDPARMYSNASWTALNNAKVNLETLLILHQSEPQNPKVFQEANEQVAEAKTKLVNISALIPFIEAFDQITDSSIYTEDSFTNYRDAIVHARNIVEAGTLADIDPAIERIVEAKDLLRYQSKITLQQLLDEASTLVKADYTTTSFATMTKLMDRIKTMDLNSLDEAERQELIDEMVRAKTTLVNIRALKLQVLIAEGFTKEKYTLSSFSRLETAIALAKGEYKAGSQITVNSAIQGLDKTTRSLELRVDKQELLEYLDRIKDIEYDMYTEASLANYKKALLVLQDMAKQPEDVSAQAFVNARSSYEVALANLEVVKASSAMTNTFDTSNQNGYYGIILLSLITMIGYARFRRKK